jgi:hypothetical protein
VIDQSILQQHVKLVIDVVRFLDSSNPAVITKQDGTHT